MVLLAPVVRQVPQVDRLDLAGLLALRAPADQQVLKALPDRQERTGLRDRQDLLGQRERPDRLGLQVPG